MTVPEFEEARDGDDPAGGSHLPHHGRARPGRAERRAGPLAAPRRLLRPLADAPAGAVQAWDASEWYAGQVHAVRGRLPAADPAGQAMTLVGRWLDGWLAQHADQDGRAPAQAFAEIAAAMDRAQREQQAEMHQDLAGRPPPERARRLGEQLLVSRVEQAAHGWGRLLVAGATVEDEADVRRHQALSDAADLLCPARGHNQRGSSHELEIGIGPPAGPGQPPADELVAELAGLAAGLNPGRWQIHTT
jgi:hypothetical protein